jgi:hypothetical protein
MCKALRNILLKILLIVNILVQEGRIDCVRAKVCGYYSWIETT